MHDNPFVSKLRVVRAGCVCGNGNECRSFCLLFCQFIDNLPHLLSITKSPSCKLRSRESRCASATRNFNLHLLLHFILMRSIVWIRRSVQQSNRPVSMHMPITLICSFALRVCVWAEKGDRATCVTTLPALFFFSSPHTHTHTAAREQFYCRCRAVPPPRNNALLLFDVCVFLQNEITSAGRGD